MKVYRILICSAIFVVASFLLTYSFMFKDTVNSTSYTFNKKRILLISNVYQNPYWQIIKKGAEDAANNRGCVLEYNGPQTMNIAQSLRIFDMGIATSVDGIITSVQDEKQYMPLIKKASAIGIPVITIDTDARNSKRIAYVGTNNIEAGYRAGQALARIAHMKANVGIITSGKTAMTQIERVNSFKDYISSYPGMEVVAIDSSNSDIVEAELVAKRMMDKHPEIDALYCTGSVDGIGAARAVVDSNRKGRIKIICFDDLPEIIDYIKQDIIHASVVQKPYQMGFDSVNLMIDKLEGQDVSGEFLMDTIVVSKDNINNYNIEKGEMN